MSTEGLQSIQCFWIPASSAYGNLTHHTSQIASISSLTIRHPLNAKAKIQCHLLVERLFALTFSQSPSLVGANCASWHYIPCNTGLYKGVLNKPEALEPCQLQDFQHDIHWWHSIIIRKHRPVFADTKPAKTVVPVQTSTCVYNYHPVSWKAMLCH